MLTLNILYRRLCTISDLFQTLPMKSRPHYRSFKVLHNLCKIYFTRWNHDAYTSTYRNFRLLHVIYAKYILVLNTLNIINYVYIKYFISFTQKILYNFRFASNFVNKNRNDRASLEKQWNFRMLHVTHVICS